MKASKRQHRRRILLMADFAYASGKAVASGVIRFASAHTGIDLLLHGRTSEMPLMRRGLVPDDLVDMRLERAKKLLVDTDIPVGRIPETCVSDVPNHFMQLFKARVGMTMLQWRRAKGASDCGNS